MTRRSLVVLLVVLAVAGCGGSSDPKGPSATVAHPSTTAPSTTTTAKPATPEQEVEAAYLKSWDVYAKAVRELDDSRLAEVYADDALSLRRDEVAELRRNKTPALIRVKHDYLISLFDNDTRALVVDAYLNHSVFIDPTTGKPTEPDPNKVVKRQYGLGLREGKWKVVSAKAQE